MYDLLLCLRKGGKEFMEATPIELRVKELGLGPWTQGCAIEVRRRRSIVGREHLHSDPSPSQPSHSAERFCLTRPEAGLVSPVTWAHTIYITRPSLASKAGLLTWPRQNNEVGAGSFAKHTSQSIHRRHRVAGVESISRPTSE